MEGRPFGTVPVKVGVYVDVANITLSGGHGMRFDVLRRFASRDGGVPIRLNAYVVYDEEKAQEDPGYRERTQEFHAVLREFGYKVIEKTVKWYTDEEGRRFGKANADLDMAVDALLQSDNLDRVLLATGDGDFVQVVRALQSRGCRVEVVAFRNVSSDLRKEADLFLSGYLIPGLLRSGEKGSPLWGEVGSRVRGLCYDWRQEEGWGFLRFLREIGPGLWITDARQEGSSFQTAFVHHTAFPPDFPFEELPSRNHILEFDLVEGEKGYQAKNVTLVHRY
jgi:uncharacterized LabA/DUF88 family protein/cold shock CspA family protein